MTTRLQDGIQSPGPIPVNPWRVPPSGSLGDDYDGAIVLDAREEAKIGGVRVRRPGLKRRNANEVLFLEWNPPLHWAAVFAWLFAAMGFYSTGPLYPLMAVWASLSILCAAAAVILVHTIHRQNSGERIAAGAGCLAVALVGLDLWRPAAEPFQRHFVQAPRSATPVEVEDREQSVEEDMRRMARVAGCAWGRFGERALEIGNMSVNSGVDSRSISFAISTLSLEIEMDPEMTMFHTMSFRNLLPMDPFSDDPYATFGVFVTDHHLLIYSPGPDGDWDINPRRPLVKDVTDPMAELRPSLFNPETGNGDIVLAVPLSTLDEWIDCDGLIQSHRP